MDRARTQERAATADTKCAQKPRRTREKVSAGYVICKFLDRFTESVGGYSVGDGTVRGHGQGDGRICRRDAATKFRARRLRLTW